MQKEQNLQFPYGSVSLVMEGIWEASEMESSEGQKGQSMWGELVKHPVLLLNVPIMLVIMYIIFVGWNGDCFCSPLSSQGLT